MRGRDFLPSLLEFRRGWGPLYLLVGYKRDRPYGSEKTPPRDLGGVFVFNASSRNDLQFLPISAVVSSSQKEITSTFIRQVLGHVGRRLCPEVSDRRRDFWTPVIGWLSLLGVGEGGYNTSIGSCSTARQRREAKDAASKRERDFCERARIRRSPSRQGLREGRANRPETQRCIKWQLAKTH